MRITLYFIFAFLLTACGTGTLSLKEICKLSDGLCEKIKPDGMCKASRKEIIISNYNINNLKEKNNEKPALQYKLLNNLETYIGCAKNAADIEYINPEDKFAKQDKDRKKAITQKEKDERKKYIKTLHNRKTDRDQNYNNARIMLSDIEDSIVNSNDQYLLYWKWSRMSNKQAIADLLILDKEGKIDNHNMLYFISQQYIKYNHKYAMNALLRSLENYPSELYVPKELPKKKELGVLSDEGRIHFSIFRTLVLLNMKEKNFKNAYIYSKLLKLNNDTSVSMVQMKKYASNYNDNINFKHLDQIAEKMHNLLEEGVFVSK